MRTLAQIPPARLATKAIHVRVGVAISDCLQRCKHELRRRCVKAMLVPFPPAIALLVATLAVGLTLCIRLPGNDAVPMACLLDDVLEIEAIWQPHLVNLRPRHHRLASLFEHLHDSQTARLSPPESHFVRRGRRLAVDLFGQHGRLKGTLVLIVPAVLERVCRLKRSGLHLRLTPLRRFRTHLRLWVVDERCDLGRCLVATLDLFEVLERVTDRLLSIWILGLNPNVAAENALLAGGALNRDRSVVALKLLEGFECRLLLLRALSSKLGLVDCLLLAF
mmetsp:Transcript_77007/g.152794  ORF Transcript_77007/g.152794 Transcript_77007/m.152794 type:complete len:278 (+) Transcript_77007:329-1162(+)